MAGLPGLIETMRVYRGRLPFLDRHVGRLNDASRRIGLMAPPPDIGTEAAAHGLRPPADRAVRVRWNGASLVWDDRDLDPQSPIRIAVVDVPHPGYPVKSTDRAAFDRATEAAVGAGADEPILCTSDGWVAEAARFAVGWLEGDALVVPDLSLEILPSIGRERLLAVAGEVGLRVESGRFPASRLDGRSVLLVNAVRGVVPAVHGASAASDPRAVALAEGFWPAG